MNRKDLHNSLTTMVAMAITAIANGENVVGAIIDRQGFDSLEFALQVGLFTDGGVTPLVEHGSDPALADAVAVPDSDLLGTEAAAALTAVGVSKVGYVGNKRYVRLTAVATALSTLTVAAQALLTAKNVEGGV